MLNIIIVAVGKLKEDYLRSASAEYEKRLKGFCSLKIIELDEFRLSDKPSEKEIANALEAEGKAILKACRGYIAAMCIEGGQLASEELSQKLDSLAVSGTSTVSIVIGSSCGLADSVKKAADLRLSMSKMTFPHQLARIMLLEQLYRAFQISAGGKYHK